MVTYSRLWVPETQQKLKRKNRQKAKNGERKKNCFRPKKKKKHQLLLKISVGDANKLGFCRRMSKNNWELWSGSKCLNASHTNYYYSASKNVNFSMFQPDSFKKKKILASSALALLFHSLLLTILLLLVLLILLAMLLSLHRCTIRLIFDKSQKKFLNLFFVL